MGIVLIVCHKNPPGKWYPISFANTFAGIVQIAGILSFVMAGAGSYLIEDICNLQCTWDIVYIWCHAMILYVMSTMISRHDIVCVMMSCPWYWVCDDMSCPCSPEVDERYSELAPVPLYSQTVWWYRYIYDVMPWYRRQYDVMPW